MKNIILVIQREYLTRVRKKSFWVLTLLMPILISGFMGLIVYFGINSFEEKQVTVIDESNIFKSKFKDSDLVKFKLSSISLDSAKSYLRHKKTDVVAFIPKNILENPKGLKLYAEKTVGVETKNRIEKTIQNEIRDIKLKAAGIDQKILESADVDVESDTISLDDEGEKASNSGVAMAIAMICVIVMYSAVIGFGMQVMKGIVEEKTSRIVEVIISSVKPFELMLGKILGVGLVGLTQFGLWILLTTMLSSFGGVFFSRENMAKQVKQKTEQIANVDAKQAQEMAKQMPDNNPVAGFIKQASSLNLGQIALCFVLFFFGGYLFYSSIFGAIGSAVDSETDTQQFMFPIMMPLIAGYLFSMITVNDPTSNLAFWASMVPFTSPIVMMVRLPFGVETWEIVLSLVILAISTVGMVWLAARIYRVGILMYGKKTSFKEIWKWLWYKG